MTGDTSTQAVAGRLLGVVRSDRLETERRRFQSLGFQIDFETVHAIVTLASVVHLIVAGLLTFVFVRTLGIGPIQIELPSQAMVPLESLWLDPSAIGTLAALLAGGIAVLLTRVAVRAALEYLLRRRRLQIERTLPGAVRYLHVIASGSVDPRDLFESVVEKRRIHGATADSFERILQIAAVTGSIETGIRRVARDTPSQDTLAPFLLTFLEKTREEPAAVREFLRIESRLLARGDERQHRQETRYLRTVVELFVVLLVVPVVLIVGAIGASFLLPEVFPQTPIIDVPGLDSALAILGSLVILVLGGGAAAFAYMLRPSGYRWAAPSPAERPVQILRRSLENPTNTLLVLLPVAIILVGWMVTRGTPFATATVVGYVLVGIPVGLVDVRRARSRAEIDRRLPEFVHAVAERMDDGFPFRRSVDRVARTVDLGPLDPHVADLAYDLEMRAHGGRVRKQALERFVARIGTAFAGRTIGLAVGALEAGADTRAAFATLQTETGRLVHADQARRSRFPVVIAVGWTVAVLIVAILVTVNLMVLDSATVGATGPIQGVVVDPTLGGAGDRRPSFYLLSQATMLASGWFAGVAGRGVYEGLLHSGALVAITFLVFRVSGLL